MHGNLWNVSKFSHSHISQPQWLNGEIIIDTGFMNYLNYGGQLFYMIFLTQLTRILSWNITNFIENDRRIICKTDLWNYLPLCRFSDTNINMTWQRRCNARDWQNHAYIFYNARFVATRVGNTLADFGFVMYQNKLSHLIIGAIRKRPASNLTLHGSSCLILNKTMLVKGALGDIWPIARLHMQYIVCPF